MQRFVFIHVIVLALSGLLSSCDAGSSGDAGPVPRDAGTGYHLELRFVSLNTSVLDELQLRFRPEGTDEQFMSIEPLSLEGGAITVSVDSMDGTLLITINGAYVDARAVDQGDGSSVYDLEVWSDDERMIGRTDPKPSLRVIGMRGGEQIAEGFLFLPEWPLTPGQRSRVNVECRPALADRCIP